MDIEINNTEIDLKMKLDENGVVVGEAEKGGDEEEGLYLQDLINNGPMRWVKNTKKIKFCLN